MTVSRCFALHISCICVNTVLV